MIKKKTLFIVVGVGMTICFLFQILLIAYFPTIMYHLTTKKENSPEPEVTYCEFPFELTYMLDEKSITINDVYVCEYVGAYWNWNQGHYRKWKGYLKSNQKEDIVLIKDGNKEIICTIGSPEYYMGDEDNASIDNVPSLIIVKFYETWTSSSLLSDEMKEYYKIDLLSWELSDPIVNTFE